MSGGRHLFVYGTLRPGDVRWALLSPFVEGEGVPDRVRGRLYDTGLGYPAAVFGGADHLIVGRTFTLWADRRERALASLDAEEGTVAGLFRRVAVTTERGVDVWAYAYGDGLALTPIASGDWFDRVPATGRPGTPPGRS